MINRRLLFMVGSVTLLAGIVSFASNPLVSSILVVWGTTAALSYPAVIGLTSNDAKWAEARGTLKMSLILFVAASVSVSASAIDRLLQAPSLTDSLLDSIGFTCFLIGLALWLIGLLMAGPSGKAVGSDQPS